MARRTSLPVTFVVPTIAILLVLSMVPTLYAIVIALQNRELSSPDYSWVWLSNFGDLFLDRRFLNAVWVSVKWEVVTVGATMIVAIGLGVLAALAPTGVPVPQPVLYHADEAVLGTPFYLMEKVEGRVFHDCALPGLSPQERRATYLAMAKALAKLHAVDPDAVGLGDYGRPGN